MVTLHIPSVPLINGAVPDMNWPLTSTRWAAGALMRKVMVPFGLITGEVNTLIS